MHFLAHGSKATFYIVLKSFKMSQFKKAMLQKYLSREKEEENDSTAEEEQQVGSSQNEPENPVSDVALLE